MRFFTDIEYVICYGLTDTGTVTNLDTQSSQACTVCTVDTLQYISVYLYRNLQAYTVCTVDTVQYISTYFVQKLTGLYSTYVYTNTFEH